MIKFDIRNRYSGSVLYTAEIDCDESAPIGVKKGLAVICALDNGTDLSNAELKGTELRGADLDSANLGGADLFRADLSNANLINADLSGADLSRADLMGADLRYTKLERSNIGRTKGIRAYATFGPIGMLQRYGYVILNDDFDPIVYLGCRAGTPKETYRAIKRKYGKKSTYAAFVRAAVNELVERNPKPENV